MTRDELLALYNKKRNEAMVCLRKARKGYHETTDPEFKEHYEIEREYFSSRKHFCEEVLKDLRELRCVE